MRQFSDSTNRNWDSTRRRFDKIRWNFGTVQDDKFKLYKVNITNTWRWYQILEQEDKWANYWDIKDDISCPINIVLGSTSDVSAIATRQACATVATEQAVHLLLDYVATYPSDRIVYRSSDMVLCAHADVGFLNETNSRSRAGAHIYLSENDPFPRFNGAVLSIAQIIKFVMASAAKAELTSLFVTAQ